MTGPRCPYCGLPLPRVSAGLSARCGCQATEPLRPGVYSGLDLSGVQCPPDGGLDWHTLVILGAAWCLGYVVFVALFG